MVEMFPISPASPKVLWWLWGLVVFLLVLTGFIASLAMQTTRAGVELSRDGLRLRGELIRRTIAHEDLDAAQARRVSFRDEPGLRPRWRTLGTAVPGYQSGWFKLHNGEKALLLLTDPQRAVYVPTRKGFALLFSPNDPEAFLRSLARASS